MRTAATITLFSLLFAAPAIVHAQGLTDARISNSDMAFVQAAARVNQFHHLLGQLAQKRAADVKVREFAARMATDQQRQNKDLLALTAEQGVIIPGDQPAALQALIDKKFADHRDADFDRQYLRTSIEDLRQLQTLLQGEAKTGEAGYLRTYAAKALPICQQHLKTALELVAQLPEK